MKDLKELSVEDVMVKQLKTVAPEQSISEVNAIFESEGFRHVPVMAFGTLVGIISRTDLMRITYGAELAVDEVEGINMLIYEARTAGDVMTKELKTVEVGAPLTEAARIMLKYQLSAVPVLDDRELVGLITTSDVLKVVVG